MKSKEVRYNNKKAINLKGQSFQESDLFFFYKYSQEIVRAGFIQKEEDLSNPLDASFKFIHPEISPKLSNFILRGFYVGREGRICHSNHKLKELKSFSIRSSNQENWSPISITNRAKT